MTLWTVWPLMSMPRIVGGLLLGVGGAVGQLHAAGLAAAADLDLGLDDHPAAELGRGRPACSAVSATSPAQHGHTVLLERSLAWYSNRSTRVRPSSKKKRFRYGYRGHADAVHPWQGSPDLRQITNREAAPGSVKSRTYGLASPNARCEHVARPAGRELFGGRWPPVRRGPGAAGEQATEQSAERVNGVRAGASPGAPVPALGRRPRRTKAPTHQSTNAHPHPARKPYSPLPRARSTRATSSRASSTSRRNAGAWAASEASHASVRASSSSDDSTHG